MANSTGTDLGCVNIESLKPPRGLDSKHKTPTATEIMMFFVRRAD